MELGCGVENARRACAAAVVSAALTAIAKLLVPTAVYAAAATDLSVKATVSAFRVGVEGTYRISVVNGGDVDTDAPVRVTSTLPAGMTFVSGGGGGMDLHGLRPFGGLLDPGVPAGTTSGLALNVDVCTDAKAVTTQLTVQYEGDTNGANDTTQRTTSVKAGQCTGPTPTATLVPGAPTPTSAATGVPTRTRTPVPAEVDLLLSSGSAGSFTIGTQPVYLHVVRNLGPRATNAPLTLVNTFAKGINFASATGDGWTCVISLRTLTCTNPEPLDVDDTTSLTLTVSVTAEAYPSVTNHAALTYPAEIDESDNTTRRPTTIRRPRPASGRPLPRSTPTRTIAPAPAGTATRMPTATRAPTTIPTPRHSLPTDLLLTKTASGVFVVGRPAFYVIRVSNIGRLSADTPITVIDTLPDSLSFISAMGNGWSCEALGQTVTCTNTNGMAAGALSTLTISVSVGEGAFPTATNEATVTYANDVNPSNNTARKPTTVRR